MAVRWGFTVAITEIVESILNILSCIYDDCFRFFFPVGKEPKAEGERKIYLYIEGKRMTPLPESINQIKSIKQQLS